MPIKLPELAKNHPIAFWVAVLLHLILLVGLFFTGFQSWEIKQQELKKPEFSVPKAITIDLAEINKEKQRLADIKKKKALEMRLKEKRLRELEDKRYKKQREINRLKEKTKKEEKAKILAEKKTKEAEKQKKVAEEQRKIAEKKTKEAEKQKKVAEEQRKIAEKKTKEAEKKKQEIEKNRSIEAKKFKKEQQERTLTQAIQEEQDHERAVVQEDLLNELKHNYINQIATRVKEKWRYQGAQDDWGCDVYILQALDGTVASVNLQSCNIGSGVRAKSFKDSIERAVYKASPLPPAPDKSVFDREILFYFRVN